MLQNAEMSFNFGAQPFKHPPSAGFTAVCQASKNNIKHSDVSGAATAVTKKVNNAPQAIIIEVIIIIITLFFPRSSVKIRHIIVPQPR